jgi:hypothetical protein
MISPSKKISFDISANTIIPNSNDISYNTNSYYKIQNNYDLVPSRPLQICYSTDYGMNDYMSDFSLDEDINSPNCKIKGYLSDLSLDDDLYSMCKTDDTGKKNKSEIIDLDNDEVIGGGGVTKKHAKYIWNLSWLAFGASLYGFMKGHADMGIIHSGVFLTSINYWRNPVPGWRKNIDIGYVCLSGMYHILRSQNAEYEKYARFGCLCSMVSFITGVYKYVYKKDVDKSIKWHGACHVFGHGSIILLYSGIVSPLTLPYLYKNNLNKLLDRK